MVEETRREKKRDRNRGKGERERKDGISCSKELFLSRKGDARAHPGFPGEDGT